MRRIILTEHRTERSVPLSVSERDRIRELDRGLCLEPARGVQDLYDITPDEKIGLVCLPDLVLEIRPKLPMRSMLFLISYCCEAMTWSSESPEYADNADLVEVLALLLSRMVQSVTRRGLLHGYRSEERPERVLRGRLLFDEQMRRRFRIAAPLEVRCDEYTADIVENRLLLSALDKLAGLPIRLNGTRRELLRAQRAFGEVSRSRFHPAQVPEVLFTRLNQHYRPAIALATLILRCSSLDLGAGSARGSAFLIDMNEVFEQFVRRALREALSCNPAYFPDKAPETKLDKAGTIGLKPDLCLLDQQQVVWVGDAKYKRLAATGYQNADLYQLLAYTVALDLPGGHLIYAADTGVSEAEHVVVRAGKKLRVTTLDLTAPQKMLHQQIAAIGARIQAERRHALAWLAG